ncbi:histidine phosphatase family protein [Tessaracoccus sp. OS52]|uniref:histidine phosphatase family protein n=1 Tax=Tessaracoccus sp. OS52 TaxID=2886691 RepID=UPI001D10EF64|nr:histidine phosphatase family protein [Tessaracoccus sp. OS52]
MNLTHLVLLRHGQTEWNHIDRMQGQADVHLDATGITQAHAAARALASRHFDAVYSSDLVRAKATADTVAADLGLPVVVDPRLQEIHMGSWSGKTRAEVEAEFPEFATLYWEGKDFRRSPEGETIAEMVERSMPALREIIERHRGHQVLVVGHGFMLAQLVQNLVGITAHARVLGGLRNAHWSEVGIAPDDNAWLIAHNVPPHVIEDL